MFAQYLHGITTIFMLHRVANAAPHKMPTENLKVSPDYLENFIVKAKAKGYSFISLDTVHDALLHGKSLSKTLTLTLDDGYLDNYTTAYPLFKKHNVPFAIYITTSFPDKSALLWWYTLEDIVIANDTLTLSDGTHFVCQTLEQKIETYRTIRQIIIHLPKEGFIDALQRLFAPMVIDWQGKVAELAMSWQQIQEISADPLATIGAHTINHLALAELSESEVIEEVDGSRKIIESHINKPVEHFCYPFGGPKEVGVRDFAIVDTLGFKTTTTTRYGSIFAEHKQHLSALPRVMLTNDFSLSRYELTAIKRCWQGRVVVD